MAQNTPYWQQEVAYKIDVRLDDEAHFLHGFELIEYTNRSPDILQELYFHLWPNAYKDQSTAFAKQQIENGSLRFYQSEEKNRGYIDSLDFKVNGSKVKIQYDPQNIDICKLLLNEPLKPGDKITISTPFRVKIPLMYSRFGRAGQSYQVSQWYPKPAVYDKSGWHPLPYLDQGEFYSEYGSFDVSITLPANYTVGATGDLQNADEQKRLDSLAALTSQIKEFADDNSFPPSGKEWKTVRYTQTRVHDFAWFADKRFHVLKGEVKLPSSERKVIMYAMFTNKNAGYWKKSLEYMHDAIYYYSLWNGEYAYQQVTAVDGALTAGGGMEYPNVTVIGDVPSDRILETYIVHEVGHNWFYGMLGSNERVYGWMDEGINTYYEQRYLYTKYPGIKLLGKSADNGFIKFLDLNSYPASYQNNLLYLNKARLNEDQPIQTRAEDFTEINLASIMYGKTALVFQYLETYLGKERFDLCMKTYFERWKFKHPQPEDIQAVFEEVSGENLTWFFGWLIETKDKIDFKIEDVKKEGEQTMVKVKNNSLFYAPVFVSALDKRDSVVETFRSDPYVGTQLFFFDSKNIDRITIDPKGVIPEITQKNNSMSVKGMFRKVEPLRIQLFGSLENRNRTQLFVTPVVGYNYYDGIMPGLAFYNHFLPFRKFEYELVPLYGTRTGKMNGTGRVAYSWYPQTLFQRITLSVNYSEFTESSTDISETDSLGVITSTIDYITGYRKIAPKIELEFKRKSARSMERHLLSFRTVLVDHLYRYEGEGIRTSESDVYNLLSYQINNSRRLNPYSVSFNIESGSFSDHKILKLSMEGNYGISYRKSSKKISLRFFGGVGFSDNDYSNLFSYDGLADYKYDNAYIQRNDPNHQQFYVMEGGFKNQVNLQNVKGLMALNVKIPFPFRLPLGIYGDIATYTGDENFYSKLVVYDYGIYVPLVENMAEIYFPIQISTYEEEGDNVVQPAYKERIRFLVNINRINPFYILRNTGLN